MGESIQRFPLFPLDLVLLPGEVMPLHIFEQRYRTMIGECLESESEFGIVWLGDGVLHEVGCTVAVNEVMEKMDDGRMNILVQGVRPFRLQRRVDDMDYPAGDILLLDEEEAVGDEETSAAARQGYADLVERVTDSRPDEDHLVGLDAYAMASTIAFENDAKQELLELRSESERLGRLATLCKRALERYDYAEQALERARSNGKVHH
ncbi:MAG: LON peptidase substrate-binding domain-containing protein [Actinomycetota bacterium]|nr:LON peptidase substrate-binding domain-containing protein [Actinomycetota bacterium]